MIGLFGDRAAGLDGLDRRQRNRAAGLDGLARRRRGARILSAFMAAALLPLLVGCGNSTATGDGSTSGAENQRLVVFAAASLSSVFTQLGEDFEADHPGVEVTFSFEGSSTLVDQLVEGAPADVFASADEATMDRAVSKGTMAGEPQQFASNVLTLITPPGNPANVTGLDSSLDGARLVICAPEVPCGAATQKLAEAQDVTLSPVSEESKVTDVRAKVESGQADAGIVYVTDAKSSGDKVDVVPIAGSDQVRNVYLIGVTAEAAQPQLAEEFIDLVQGPAGKAALTEAGFGS